MFNRRWRFRSEPKTRRLAKTPATCDGVTDRFKSSSSLDREPFEFLVARKSRGRRRSLTAAELASRSPKNAIYPFFSQLGK